MTLPEPLYDEAVVKKCACCHSALPAAKMRRHAKWCSEACKKADLARQYRELNGKEHDLSSGTVGAISELVVAADLLRRGHEVFRALSPACSCDLAVMIKGQLIRVEVRTGYRTATGNPGWHRGEKDNGRQDVWAIVLNGNEIHYEPPIETWGS